MKELEMKIEILEELLRQQEQLLHQQQQIIKQQMEVIEHLHQQQQPATTSTATTYQEYGML